MPAALQQLVVWSRARIGGLAACLLAAAGAAGAAPGDPAQPVARPVPAVDALAAPAPAELPPRRGGAAPQLPEPQLAAPPASGLSLPAVTPPAAAAQPLQQGPRFVL